MTLISKLSCSADSDKAFDNNDLGLTTLGFRFRLQLHVSDLRLQFSQGRRRVH